MKLRGFIISGAPIVPFTLEKFQVSLQNQEIRHESLCARLESVGGEKAAIFVDSPVGLILPFKQIHPIGTLREKFTFKRDADFDEILDRLGGATQ